MKTRNISFRQKLLWIGVFLLMLASCRAAPTNTTAQNDGQRRKESVVDDVGRTVELAIPARRAVVFNAFNLELVRAVGAFQTVAGMDADSADKDYAGYWKGFDPAHIAGKSIAEPYWEQIVNLEPEVFIIPRNGAWQAAIGKLSFFHIPVLVVTGWDPARYDSSVTLLGKIFDNSHRADELKAFYVTYRNLLRDRLAGVPRKRVFLENAKDFTSPIPGSGWHDMIEMAGGKNIFDDITLPGGTTIRGSVHEFEIDPEAILTRDPEIILKVTGGGYNVASAGDLSGVGGNLLHRPGWNTLRAVKTGNVRVSSSYPFNVSSKIIGALYLAVWLHPEKMVGIDPDAVMKEWVEAYEGVPLPNPSAYYQKVNRNDN